MTPTSTSFDITMSDFISDQNAAAADRVAIAVPTRPDNSTQAEEHDASANQSSSINNSTTTTPIHRHVK